MVKIKASEEGTKQINDYREAKQWTKDQNSEALIITSQQQFRRAVEENLQIISEDNTPLSIEQLKNLAKKEIFTLKSTNTLRDDIDKLESKKITKITLGQFLKKIELKELHTKGISYRNWQDFLQGKEIDKDIFIAFCKALEIENWEDVAVLPLIYSKNNTKQARLVEGLSLFNHQKQVNLLLQNFGNKTGVFLVANQCQYSRTWMLRRLEAKISETIRLKCKPISLISTSYSSFGIPEVKSRFYQEYSITKIVKILKEEHLLLVIDVDSYDLKTIEDLIVQFWQPLVNQLEPKNHGRIFMFLLASNRKNDWQGKWQTNSLLSKQITELPPANSFQVEDVAHVLLEIAARLPKELSEPSEIAARLIDKSQGSSEKLLKEIYRYFECRTTEFSLLWQKYPH